MYKHLRDLREDSDLTQEFIANVLGCSRSNYTMIENGYLYMSIEKLVRLADFYHTSVDYLIGLLEIKNGFGNFNPYKKSTLIDNIKKLRKSQKMRQSYLAETVLKCTQSTYSQYETGKRRIDSCTLVALAKYYKVSIDFLLGRVESHTPYCCNAIEANAKNNE